MKKKVSICVPVLNEEKNIVILVNKIDPDVKIKANGTLISWAVENLIRNGIDAIYNENGKVMKGPNYFKPDLSKFIK